MDKLVLTKKLISLRTDPGNTKELNQALDLLLSQVQEYTTEEFWVDGVRSALVHNQKQGARNFKIILNGHLDVIPGKDYQYSPLIKGRKLYGTGALDMKANLVTMLAVFKQVASKINYPLALQIATDEELGGFLSTKHQVDSGVKAEFVIAGETTQFDIANQARGIIWLEVIAKGKTAHGAYPWRGKNAILLMSEFLTRLEKIYPQESESKWATTINVSQIETTNTAYNKVPDDCKVKLDIRFIPNDRDAVIKKIESLLTKDMSCKVIVNEDSVNTSANNFFLTKLKQSAETELGKKIKLYGAQGSSDARHYTKHDVPGVEFGPIGGGIASDNEWIDIDSLDSYQRILTNFLLNL